MPIDLANIIFRVEDGCLLMSAVARGGTPYRHACPLESFVLVAHELDAAGTDGITREQLHDRTKIPWTRINVAITFLFERSIVDRSGRRGRLYVPTSGTVFEDAMLEYHALRENGPTG